MAEHAPLPAKLGELTAAVAAILERHMTALDLRDESSKVEYDAYLDLVTRHRNAAAQLQEIARQMAGYRELPMGRHDPKAMASPEVIAAFQQFVRLEQELVELLQTRLEEDRHMLVDMAGVAGDRYTMVIKDGLASITVMLREPGPVGTAAEGDLGINVSVDGKSFRGQCPSASSSIPAGSLRSWRRQNPWENSSSSAPTGLGC